MRQPKITMAEAHDCDWHGCKEPATHSVRLCVPHSGIPIDMHRPLSIILGLECCIDHARQFDAQEMIKMNPDLFEAMTRHVDVDLSRVFVEPILLDHPEMLMPEMLMLKKARLSNERV